jgi:hypothetical protein
MSFKQFLKEAKEVNYEFPPARAKFQLGDLVVVRDDGRYLKYHSKKAIPYINQIGEVVGYKNVPGAYTKFALKFPDGNTLLLHSNFLHGPFKDLKTAEKYTDPKVTINPTDIKVPQKATKLTGYQKRDNVESALKDFLPKIGYTLLDKPIEIISNNSQYVYTVFATMDIENCKKDRYTTENIIPGKYACYRENKISSKKLKSAMAQGFNNIIGISDHSNGFGYFIQAPERNTGQEIDTNTLFTLQTFGIPNNTELLKQKKIINYFVNYRNKLKEIKEGKFSTDLDIVKEFYEVEGDTITGNVYYNKVKLQDPYFYKLYKIVGDFTLFEIDPQRKDLSFAPKEVTGDFIFAGENLTSLNGLPKATDYKFYNVTLNGRKITDKDIEVALTKHQVTPETRKAFEELLDEL